MHVGNVLHAARWKYMTQKLRKKSPSAPHRTTLSSYIFATKTLIDNRKKLLSSNVSPDVPQYSEAWPSNDWDRFGSLGILPPDGILPGAKFTLRPKSCVLL